MEIRPSMQTAAGTAPLIVIDDFLSLDLASAMRRDIDDHFANPHLHRPETHQVWNYWFVPELYTYLRTQPEKVISHDRVTAFHNALRVWSGATLGMANVTWPYLSLYVGGCRQGWHNDSLNGRFAFVYSLTQDQRQTVGGETMVMRETDPFRGNLAKAGAGRSFYDTVAPRFNRLAVFDDRLPHGVERVDGSMDPIEGRFVLHGHLSEGGIVVEGSLPATDLAEAFSDIVQRFKAETAAAAALYNGVLVLRLRIGAAGQVEDCRILADRVLHPDPGHAEWEPVRASLMARFKAVKFPPAVDDTVVIQPVVFGSPVAGAG